MKVLLTEQQLRDGIRRMADEIQGHYQGRHLTIVGVLIGDMYRNLPYVGALEAAEIGR